VLSGKFSYSNGIPAGAINRVTYFSYVNSGAAQGDEDGWSLNLPNIQWKDYPAFGAQENATSANYFYSNDGYVYKGSKFSGLSTITDRSQLGALPDTQYAPNGWWVNPFEFTLSTGNSSSNGIKTDTTADKDILTGSPSLKEIFTFSATPSFGRDSADRITNFVSKGKFRDTLAISKSAYGFSASKATFKAVSSDKALAKAAASKSLFVYDKRDGGLYLNADGSTPGFGDNGGLFAFLETRPGLTAANISLIG
jgi:hypothetical protein